MYTRMLSVVNEKIRNFPLKDQHFQSVLNKQ